MSNGKSASKSTSKPTQQLLFSEALQHSCSMSYAKGPQQADLPTTSASPAQDTVMECILQEITAVSRRLEGIDSTICMLAAETKSIRLDIVGFQALVTGLEQCVTTMEDHINTMPECDQELLCLRSKLINLEDRSRRDNVNFFQFSGTTGGVGYPRLSLEYPPYNYMPNL
ncbi:hypothetical protein NDU88_004291 [Pleurodeles waltl]|uniref:Uncharacterized protein n=1 Tax=Pleurodeles waltl TaxID=8319 RepID=A0AAV7PEQ5_PLEWA|nr:hypothetical protein NDU88_004291 [Pleurodeles waltl]